MSKTAVPILERSLPQDLPLFRIGGIAGVSAVFVGIVANALHPRLSPRDLGDQEKVLEMVSNHALWRIDHLAIIFSILAGVVAAAAIMRSIANSPGASWGRVALVMAVVSGAAGTVSLSVDGFVVAAIADDWAAATSAEARAVILERMAVIHYFDVGLFGPAVAGLFGLTQLLAGIALYTSALYPRWVALAACAAGLSGLASGTSIALSGETNTANFLVLFTMTSVLFAAWVLPSSLSLLRRARLVDVGAQTSR